MVVTDGSLTRRSLPSGSSRYSRRLSVSWYSSRPTPGISRASDARSTVAVTSFAAVVAGLRLGHQRVRLPLVELGEVFDAERHQPHLPERLGRPDPFEERLHRLDFVRA